MEIFIKDLLQEQYELGDCIAVAIIKDGDTNNSFLARMRAGSAEQTWYVRQYNTAEQEQDIVYEHAFERYFDKNVNGEIQTMLPVQAKSGQTWVTATHNGQTNFYAVFNVIKGLEPYSWEHNNLTEDALISCAEITAKFQAWAYGFVGPEGSGRREPPLEEQFEMWRADLPAALEEKRKDPRYRRFTDFFATEIPFLLDTVEFCRQKLMECRDGLKTCINHKDMNPGNVMFDENDRVIAVFDLDWVNTDYRLYDVAWMGYQAIASWDAKDWGAVPIDKLNRFIAAYNRVMVERQCPLGPLNETENRFLPIMMIIGAMKVIMDFSCYEDHSEEVYRMFVNTWRFVSSVRVMRQYVESNG